ncbi:hypothetical protein RJ641_022857 [Dillenia turbinata]|uniref:Uncharacterized protein n=1 Tax=Dillenia turbinata TaxID=194707 RepID=A0AAN8UL80_9MAGN
MMLSFVLPVAAIGTSIEWKSRLRCYHGLIMLCTLIESFPILCSNGVRFPSKVFFLLAYILDLQMITAKLMEYGIFLPPLPLLLPLLLIDLQIILQILQMNIVLMLKRLPPASPSSPSSSSYGSWPQDCSSDSAKESYFDAEEVSLPSPSSRHQLPFPET